MDKAASNYEYQALMAAMEVSVSKHLLDEHFTLIEGNDYYYKVIRYQKEEYERLFHNRPDLYYGGHGYMEELKRISDIAVAAIAEGRSGYSVVTRMPVKGGGHVWVRMTGRFTDEYVDGYRVSYTVITDINDLVQMQMEQSVTYNHIPGFVAKCLMRGQNDIELLDANIQFREFFDLFADERTSLKIPLKYLGWDAESFQEKQEEIKKGAPLRFSANVKNKKGEVRRVQISGECMDWMSGVPIYLFVYIDVTDLTDLREMQKKLEEQAEKLKGALNAAEDANRAKSDFLSRMSHDIRTPLNAIVGMTEIAGSHLKDSDKVKDCLRKITTSSQHLLGLINDVLDMSKIESGQMALRTDAMYLPEIMDNIVTIIQPILKTKNQHFSIRLHNLNHEHFICDSLRLHQCFINILSNASKFTPNGGRIMVEVEEKTGAKPGIAEMTFIFSDTGIGINEEFLPHIFDVFTREQDGRVDKIEGSGLGMAITKKIVDLMNGTIIVESKLGEGTTFRIHLPMEISEVKLEEVSLPPLKVLVADDDEIMCEYTVQTLSQCGIDAVWVNNGIDAVEQVKCAHQQNADFDVVILDWKMPKQDGIETVRQIRSQVCSDIPILIASAYDWSEIEAEAVEVGVTAFLSKPLFRSTIYFGLLKYVLGEDVARTDRREKHYDFTGKRILLAEDNELNQEIAIELLEESGAEVYTVSNGKECVEAFEQFKDGYFNLILMDIRMPIMDGYAAARKIRGLEQKDAAAIPILAMTADAFAEDIAAAKQAGMNGHLSKPLDVAAMRAEISRLI